MSGFVGIVNFDGAPVDRELLERLTDYLAFRGPDGKRVWRQGSVGFGHTLLRVTREAARESQPFVLDGRLWIVADARVDAREQLIGDILSRRTGRVSISLETPDVELILHAYDVWGEACVEHLLGDFSFAIWDGRERKLFCARDHFGVRPFFYAHVGTTLVFSNTLDCLRQHPLVSDRLNDLAIADFLLFEMNQDRATTSFADIQRLPAAHTLACTRDTLSRRQYWSLSVTEPVHFKQDRDYLTRFRELLDRAVADRLRTNSVGILLSGGLDSSAVAAAAKAQLAQSQGQLFAYTTTIDGLIPDSEGHYARLVAERLSLPIEFQPVDDCGLFDRADKPEYRAPEPENSAWPGRFADQLREIAAKSPVVLTGQGSDPGLSSRITVHFRNRMRHGQYAQAVADAVRYLNAEGRFSRLYLRGRLRILLGNRNPYFSYPVWLNEDLEKRFELPVRWRTYELADRRAIMRLEANFPGVRPEATMAMSHVTWQSLCEEFDSGATRVPVELRHPFFDLRLLRFLLGLPRLPWCCDKELLRQAARGVLPEAVRLRRKSPLQADPTVALLARPESAWLDQFDPVPELQRYVRRSRIPRVHGKGRSGEAWVNLRPLSLNFWLRGRNARRIRN